MLQKLPAPAFSAETLLEFRPLQVGEEAGIVLMGLAYGALALRHTQHRTAIILRTDVGEQYQVPLPFNTIRLRVAITNGGRVTFSYAPPERAFTTLDETFQAREGKWIGAKVGLYSLVRQVGAPAGHADVAYFRLLA